MPARQLSVQKHQQQLAQFCLSASVLSFSCIPLPFRNPYKHTNLLHHRFPIFHAFILTTNNLQHWRRRRVRSAEKGRSEGGRTGIILRREGNNLQLLLSPQLWTRQRQQRLLSPRSSREPFPPAPLELLRCARQPEPLVSQAGEQLLSCSCKHLRELVQERHDLLVLVHNLGNMVRSRCNVSINLAPSFWLLPSSR